MDTVDSAAAHKNIKILIVEDDAVDRAAYRRVFSRNDGFTILESDNVQEGLDLMRREAPDCILLDYRLPDGSGIDFITRCQQGASEGAAAIIMVTGQGSEQTAVEAMKLGAVDYITKEEVADGVLLRNILSAIERTQLKNAVQHYQQQLEKSYGALSEFTHTASHDLKAPLRHIISYCELIRDEFGERLGEEGVQYTARLIVNARRLQRLVDDLLAYSEALNTIEEKEYVDVDGIAAEIIEFLEETIAEHKATVTVEALPRIYAYPLRIKQLLQNLVSNALKYKSDAAPVIRITCEDKGHEYLFSVADNGLGIEDEHKEMIFESFKRLHSRDKIEGSGLGLSICKKIINMHNGRIWVESTAGKGSTFFFTIPRAAPAA